MKPPRHDGTTKKRTLSHRVHRDPRDEIKNPLIPTSWRRDNSSFPLPRAPAIAKDRIEPPSTPRNTEEHRDKNPIELVLRVRRPQLSSNAVPSWSQSPPPSASFANSAVPPLRPDSPSQIYPRSPRQKNYLKSGHHLCDKETQTDRTKAGFGRTRLWDVNRAMRRAACPGKSSGLVRLIVSAAQ